MYRILFEEQCLGADGFGGQLLRVYSRRRTGVHWLGLRLYLSGMPCRENTALSAVIMLLEVVEASFVT